MLMPHERQAISLQALSKQTPISDIAKEHNVSRNFVYRQQDKGQQALDQAFSPQQRDDKVLFYLPVTAATLRQIVFCLALICRSSMRGIIEFMKVIFDQDMSLGTVHNIIHEAVPKAREINASYNLSTVRAGAHDELYQGDMPVLAGMDLDSNYCYMLVNAEHRDAVTWGTHLLDCVAQGLHPEYTVADGGTGLRAGQNLVWNDVPCFGDNFHLVRELTCLVGKLDRKACACLKTVDKLEHSMAQAKQKGKGNTLSTKLTQARVRMATAIHVADTVRTLCGWLRHDILALSSLNAATRAELYDFICTSLQEFEADDSRIASLRRSLEHQQSQALAFAHKLDEGIAEIAADFNIPEYPLRQLIELHSLKLGTARYYALERTIYRQLHHYLHPVREAVETLLTSIHHSSSLIENLNGRLRNYFFLRRQVGPDYLELLRFFLNHHPFVRSAHQKKVGKSPVELLTGEKHPHWLELLGFTLFKRTANAA
jgi:hypothetical protein